jgi:hypothetical protein
MRRKQRDELNAYLAMEEALSDEELKTVVAHLEKLKAITVRGVVHSGPQARWLLECRNKGTDEFGSRQSGKDAG